jgi:hypothetical protein
VQRLEGEAGAAHLGDWKVLEDAVLTEVSILSPSRTPADALARVELPCKPETSPVAIPGNGQRLIRYFQTPITVR